ncbi:hypothetical protein ACVTMO_16865 [Pseudomonas segetis]
MSELAYIQMHDPLRNTLAEQMAAYEALHGPVETLPIRIGDPDVTAQSNLKSVQSVGRTLSDQRIARVRAIRQELADGGTIESAAEKAGVTRAYASRIVTQHGMQVK